MLVWTHNRHVRRMGTRWSLPPRNSDWLLSRNHLHGCAHLWIWSRYQPDWWLIIYHYRGHGYACELLSADLFFGCDHVGDYIVDKQLLAYFAFDRCCTRSRQSLQQKSV